MPKADLIYLWLAVINLTTIWAYYHDKQAAKWGKWRVPENTLFGLAIIGGSPAALIAARMFRHKNKKYSFRLVMWVIILVQITVYVVWADHQ